MAAVIVPIYRPFLEGNVSAYVAECVGSGWISSRGPFIAKFEEAFAAFTGAAEATSVANGTVALHLALVALGIGPGDEVIVPSFTYIASVNTILQAGATPVFAESLADTLQVDPASVRSRITPRTRAIMAVHLYGHPSDMTALGALCRAYGLLLIEDAAESFGASWRGQHTGTFGDVGTFSFFGNKTITTGEGGMVLARDPKIMARCRQLKNQGIAPGREYWHEVLGYNYRMTNIQAAIGLAQIELAPKILARKRAIAAHYREALAGLPLRTHDAVGDAEHSHWMCSILLDDATRRAPVRADLAAQGIETRPFFAPAHTMPHCRSPERLPVAEDISARGINLPSFPGLEDGEVARICAIIRATLEGRAR